MKRNDWENKRTMNTLLSLVFTFNRFLGSELIHVQCFGSHIPIIFTDCMETTDFLHPGDRSSVNETCGIPSKYLDILGGLKRLLS